VGRVVRGRVRGGAVTAWALGGLLNACGHAGDAPDPPFAGEPLIVVFTTDTLGLAAAEDTGWCDDIQGLAGAHGMDAACLEGGVPPASWTGESHTRLLWPQHLASPRRGFEFPDCDAQSVLADLADATGGELSWGADNAVLGSSWSGNCPNVRPPWFNGADHAYDILLDGGGLAVNPEADRPADHVVDDLVAATAAGEPAVAFLNAFEVGGHFPRCWFDPHTEACDALWAFAVDQHVVATTADPAAKWAEDDFQRDLLVALAADLDHEAEHRGPMWASMREKILHFRGPMVDDRLERILAAVETAGRADDLVLLVLGDHGENPCVLEPDGGRLTCSHGGIPTEWTANVPVFVIPASAADDWQDRFVGDATTPWSTANLAWALLDRYGVEPPRDWPEMLPVGTATSWTCRRTAAHTETSTGLRVVGPASARCLSGSCYGRTWEIPTGADGPDGEPLEPMPSELAGYTAEGADNWFEQACAELE
jgi:hypothetical protein